MASSSHSVTIDKIYFETLLRKAQNSSSHGKDHSTPANLSMVTIPKPDYDNLVKLSREYGNLRKALYSGGITDEQLEVLISQGDGESSGDVNTIKHPSPDKSSMAGTYTDIPDSITDTTEDFYSQNPRTTGTSSYVNTRRATNTGMNYDTESSTSGFGGYNGKRGQSNNNSNYQFNGNYYNDYGFVQAQANGYFDPHDGQSHGFYQNGNAYVEEYEQPPKLKKIARRTVNLGGLDKATTHADITAVVVGGPLLDIFLRTRDRICSVSFVDDGDANAFYHYARKNDLYIRGKRVQVFWAETHFTLPNHVANKINIGATRNVLIHNAASRHTEASIREDLEHIHNCIVISVKFIGGNAKIETNAVHNAMFARTCMMSRAKYKGSKIEWTKDDCDVPVPEKKIPLMPTTKANKQEVIPTNRFEVLSLDSGYDTETGLGLAKGKMKSSVLEIR